MSPRDLFCILDDSVTDAPAFPEMREDWPLAVDAARQTERVPDFGTKVTSGERTFTLRRVSHHAQGICHRVRVRG